MEVKEEVRSFSSFMLPIRCFTCGRCLRGEKTFEILLSQGLTIKEALDEMEIIRECCRGNFLSTMSFPQLPSNFNLKNPHCDTYIEPATEKKKEKDEIEELTELIPNIQLEEVKEIKPKQAPRRYRDVFRVEDERIIKERKRRGFVEKNPKNKEEIEHEIKKKFAKK